ncbi:hypothetical protein GDO81_019340, partial [Engystomops pustulosus]
QPYETHPLTITWTPSEEGGIRELVTFLLNDVVKHQAVLLGRAELPVKKKRSRWNTVRKKYSPVGSKAPQMKTKVSTCSKNKTFSLTSKSGHGSLPRARSPLQSCENLSTPMTSPSPLRESRRSTENRLPVGHISPLASQLQAFTPGSLKRSKTYSVLCTTEYSETIEEVTTTSTIQRDVLIEEEWTLSEQMVNKVSMSPINPVNNQQGNFICTPSVIHEYSGYPALSPSEFCKTEVKIKHSHTSHSFQEYSHKHSGENQTPPTVLQTPQRNILSPDSFVNNSFVVSDEYLMTAPSTPILSPDQFVKDNFLTQIDSEHLGVFSLNTPPCTSSAFQEEVKISQFASKDRKLTDRTPEDFEPVASRLTFCVKKPKGSYGLLRNDRPFSKGSAKPPIITSTVTKVKAGHGGTKHIRPQSPSLNDATGIPNPLTPPIIPATVTTVEDGHEKQPGLQSQRNDVPDMKDLTKLPIISDPDAHPKDDPWFQPLHSSSEVSVKPPIASATVVKVKAVDRVDMGQKLERKARRRLKNIESDGVVQLPDLPMIHVSDSTASASSSVSSTESLARVSKAKSICGHKRRSEEMTRDDSVACSDSLQNVSAQSKRVHFSKTSLSQQGGKQTQQTRSANLVLKSNGRIQKVKAETIKIKPALTKANQKENTGIPAPKSALTFKSSNRVVAVAQSKLTFMKPPKTVIPRHPMPFAAKNMFYDERWMAKQERGFTWWLNFILTPDEFAVKIDLMKVNAAVLILGAENNHKVSVPKAPTKEEVSLKAYTARCRLNKLRRSACRLFTSEPVVRAIRRLEIEIEARRLLVRKDRHLWKDIGERQKILNWLLSYNPLWLRVGLE